jgi:large subunit ribosomal protein L7/L12
LGLKESKEFIDNLPKLYKKFSSKEEANQIKKELEEAGAIITLK